MAIGGHQVGPVSQDDVITNLRNGTIDGNTLVFTEGMKNWTPLKDVPQLAAFLGGAPGARPSAAPPPPVPGRRAHEIDFRIVGSEMQFVEIELDPVDKFLKAMGVGKVQELDSLRVTASELQEEQSQVVVLKQQM